jgi:hypothetical protein
VDVVGNQDPVLLAAMCTVLQIVDTEQFRCSYRQQQHWHKRGFVYCTFIFTVRVIGAVMVCAVGRILMRNAVLFIILLTMLESACTNSPRDKCRCCEETDDRLSEYRPFIRRMAPTMTAQRRSGNISCALTPPTFANTEKPTATEVRRRAIWNNWRGIADRSAPGGGLAIWPRSLPSDARARIPGAGEVAARDTTASCTPRKSR